MSENAVKSIIALAFLIAGTVAFLTMMTVMGRAERKADPARLRKVHRAFGYAYLLLLVPLVVFGAGFLRQMGDGGMSLRGTFHFVLADALLVLVLLKILTVRFFKHFQKYAAGLGMAVFSLSVVVFLLTAGFFFLSQLP